MPCWESVKGHASCPVSELSGWKLMLFIRNPLAAENVLLKQQFGLDFSGSGFKMRSPLGFSGECLLSLIRNFM